MLQANAVIGGRYRLISLLGEGGMASVWRAEDQTLARPVAIKLLYMQSQRDPQPAIEQFLREARLAASVQHRNVVHIVDFGVTAEQLPFMVMELLQGESLADRLARSPELTPEEVVHIADLILRGLSAVHEAGIVHRDLKPQNVLLQRESDGVYPKIVDFGISRSLGTGSASAIATQQGLIVGTPEYMAPEQARGEGDIDRRADIYAMGVILYEALTGRTPFQANTIGELIVKIVTATAPPVRTLRSTLPEALSQCVAQAMSPDRTQRFADAAAFRSALRRAAELSFGSLGAVQGSELPPWRADASPPHAASPPMPARVVPPVAAGSARSLEPAALARESSTGGWGDLEAPGSRVSSARTSQAGSVAAPRGAAARVDSLPARAAVGGQARASAAGPARPSHAGAGGARASAAHGAGGRTAGAAREPPLRSPVNAGGGKAASGALELAPRNSQAHADALQVAHNESLFGDNPLDSFATAGGELQLDLEHAPGFAARMSAANTGVRVSQRSTEHVVQVVARSRPRARSGTAGTALWLLAAALLLAFVLLLVAPGLFSPAPPDLEAAARREAENPATRDRRPYRIAPRPKLADVAPALRELTF